MKYVDYVKTKTVDLDQYDRVKPYVYLDFFQDIAGEHASALGVGYEVSKSKNIAWILMKNKLDVYNIPKPYETLIIRTWPSGQSKIDYTRDYEVLDKGGNCIATGSSQWCIVDITTHKILRTANLSLPVPEDVEVLYPEKFKRLENYDYKNEEPVCCYQIQQSDIDHYHHTNNARYAQIVYNAIPEQAKKTIKHFEINYHFETKLAEKIKLYYKEENDSYHGCGVTEKDVVAFTFRASLKE